MGRDRSALTCFLFLGLLLISVGCIPTKQARVAAVALTVNDVANAAGKRPHLTIVREGTPAYLMLLDGLIEAYPNNKDLLVAGSQAYSSYASSFVADDNPEEAKALYLQAKTYGFRALSDRADFEGAVAGSLDDFQSTLQKYRKEDVPALFWTANAWASWISSDLNNMEALAEIPMLEATMKRILELDNTFYYGGPHLLMGTYLAAKPAALGGDLHQSQREFEKAFALGSDKLLAAKVLYARYYARNSRNRELYVKTLEEVLEAPADTVPELTLANTVAKKQARQMLDRTEEYFEELP